MIQFIAPAILLIGILAGIWLNRRDYEGLRREVLSTMDQRFSIMDQRFEAVNQRFAAMDKRFEEIDQRFVDMNREMNRQFDEVNRRLGLIETNQKQFFTITGKLDGRIDEIAKR